MNRRSFLTISTALAAGVLGWPALSRSFAAAPAQSGGTRPKVLTGEGREMLTSASAANAYGPTRMARS